MSSTEQTASYSSTPSSPSNFQLIVNAVAEYAKQTGIDLATNPFAVKIERSNSPDAILELLQEREKAFKEYREGNRRLITCLTPAVTVLHTFSGILGVAVSLVPFSPAKAVFTGIDVLLAAASGVSSSYDALLELFERLGNFLKRVEIYKTIPPTIAMMDIIVKIMVEVLSVLALATKQIKEGRFKKFTKKLLGKCKIDKVEAVLQKLDRLTQEETRMAVTQTLGVVYGLEGNVRGVIEDGRASTRDQLQINVQHWLSPPDPSTNHDLVWKAHHAGTASWFFESHALRDWKKKGSLLWIHGKPGSGKSTLLSAIIQDIEGMRVTGLTTMAYYYFDFRDAKKQDRYGLLSSLLSQLSAKSYSCSDILSRLYSDHAGGTGKPTTNTLTKCMKDMLSLPGQGSIYIIIDALDECSNVSGMPSAREQVLELVEELARLDLPNVHLCVASRPEIDVRMALEPLKPLQISLHDESGQKEDINKYIKSVVYSDRNMRKWREEDQKVVIDALSQNVDGMFRWVVCQLDRLRRCFPASIRSTLADLPESLDKTYEQTLLRIDKEKRKYAQRLFQCLSVSIRPLRVEELAEILAVQFDATAAPSFNEELRPWDAEEAVLSACSSLIAIVDREDGQVVQFSHFSVKEFLTSDRLAKADEHLSCYHILPEPAHTLLAHSGLSVLLQLDDKIDRNGILGRFPLAPYAARHWIDHAQYRNVSSHIEGVMERLFDGTSPHFAAWVWLYDIDHYWADPMSSIHPTKPEAVPLYYAALCGLGRLVGRLIVSHSPDINSRGGSHTTPLHAATVKGHVEVTSLLLESGADPNSRDDMDRVPLHRVSHGGHLVKKQSSLEIARLLVNSGADLNVTDVKGWSPLHAAARNGYREIVQQLLVSGASIDAQNENQETPLHLSCGNGKLEVSRFLIDQGSDINSRCKDALTPLHMASRFGHLDVARLLLNSGSDVNVRDIERSTPLHYASQYGHFHISWLLISRSADVDARDVEHCTALHDASSNGHFDTVKLLVERGANIDSRNDKGETALCCAARKGYLDIARLLVESGAAVSIRDNNGWTPLHKASYSGHLHISKYLLECCIDVNIRTWNEATSLYLACSNGKLDVARFLIEHGADIYANNNDGLNPLHIASFHGHLDVVRMLNNTGIAVDIRDGKQWTPLAFASFAGKVEVGRFLLERGADMNARAYNCWAPLHIASLYGYHDVVRLLLDHGVDANIVKDDLWSPLHLSSNNGYMKVAELLVQRGASVDMFNNEQETPLVRAAANGNVAISRLLIDNGANLHSTDSNGWTPLHTASCGGHLGVVKLLLWCGADLNILNNANKTAAEVASENGQAEVVKYIAEHKADTNIRNKMDSTTLDTTQDGGDEDGKDIMASLALHAAVEERNIDAVKLLLERGEDINGRNSAYETPLHSAAAKENVDVMRLLIERGAEVDSRDMWGCTPLHYSSREGYLEVSRVLVDHGANVNAREREHFTPIHISAGNGRLEIVELLLERGADVLAVSSDGQTPYQLSLAYGYREVAELLRERGGYWERMD